MNQLYTEYLIDFAVKERHQQAARWEQARVARAARPGWPESVRTFLHRFRINRPQPGESLLIPTVANEPQRATPC